MDGDDEQFQSSDSHPSPNGEERKTRLGRGGSVVGFLNLCIDYSIYVQ